MFTLHMWPDVIQATERAAITAEAQALKTIGWLDRTTGTYVYEKPDEPVRFKRVHQCSYSEVLGLRMNERILGRMKNVLPGALSFKQQLLLMGYSPGDTFGWHSDSHSMKDGTWTRTPGREGYDWSIVLYANSEFTGGELEFRNGLRYKPVPGALLAFPSEFVHRVTPVESGHRLAFTTFMEHVR
jgi:predicted 2-oxoglutarate/Fe(II)-dependent dioxygenase YbiX